MSDLSLRFYSITAITPDCLSEDWGSIPHRIAFHLFFQTLKRKNKSNNKTYGLWDCKGWSPALQAGNQMGSIPIRSTICRFNSPGRVLSLQERSSRFKSFNRHETVGYEESIVAKLLTKVGTKQQFILSNSYNERGFSGTRCKGLHTSLGTMGRSSSLTYPVSTYTLLLPLLFA